MLACCFDVQIEFMAEDEMVEIVPNLRMDSLNFICVMPPSLPLLHAQKYLYAFFFSFNFVWFNFSFCNLLIWCNGRGIMDHFIHNWQLKCRFG